MKKKIFVYTLIVLIIGVIIFEVYSITNILINHKNNKVLEDIKKIDVFDNKDKTLSIMVQDPTTYEYKSDTSRTSWPQKTEYMYAGTKCTDASGTDVGDTTPYLKFEESDYTATITTKKTIYCTLYFANGRPALEVLKATNDDTYAGGGQHTIAVEGLYRYYGTAAQVTNNYICLGDENPDVCKTNTNNMYRIIGVTDGSEADSNNSLGLEKGMLKVIKATPSNESQAWGNSSSDSSNWDSAKAQKDIQEFYNTESTIDARIKPYIANVYWWKGDRTNATLSDEETKTKQQNNIA